jgi:hypothetical protein
MPVLIAWPDCPANWVQQHHDLLCFAQVPQPAGRVTSIECSVGLIAWLVGFCPAGDLLPEERLLLSHQLCPWATHDGRLHFPPTNAAEESSETAAV